MTLPSTAAPRPWLPDAAQTRESEIRAVLPEDVDGLSAALDDLVGLNRVIHDEASINLDPASNVMNPAAEAMLSAGLGNRPSLGHPGGKYETGLEAIEQIEVMAADLACRVMGAAFAEVRIPSGSIANLHAFMATCKPGDAIIVPPPTIGGHVTHDRAGAAGLYGLQVHHAPIDAGRHTVDLAGLADLADQVRPALITIGGSLNLLPHPVGAIREVADAVGARVLFDAAHACGMIAGRQWPNPLAEGAHLLTMSTYKSLGGPPAGLVVTDDPDLAARIDRIAHPGLSANFDAGNTAALARSLLDWVAYGTVYAEEMVAAAQTMAAGLAERGIPVHTTAEGPTTSHHLAVVADGFGGGGAAARRLRPAGLLASAIGLPAGEGLRLGTPELVRTDLGHHADEVADLVAQALTGDPEVVAPRVADLRRRHPALRHIRA